MPNADDKAGVIAKQLATYDEAIVVFQKASGDAAAEIFLDRRTHDLNRLMRHADSDLTQKLAEYREVRQTMQHEWRTKLRQEDRERQAQAAKQKIAAQAKT